MVGMGIPEQGQGAAAGLFWSWGRRVCTDGELQDIDIWGLYLGTIGRVHRVLERTAGCSEAGARRGLSDLVGKGYMGKGAPSGLGYGLPKILIGSWGSEMGSS